MKYYNLNGENISRLGFACMRFNTIDNDNSKIDKETSSKIILEAINQGLTYIDTAYPYHDGMSEKFIGEFLEANNNLFDNKASLLASKRKERFL